MCCNTHAHVRRTYTQYVVNSYTNATPHHTESYYTMHTHACVPTCLYKVYFDALLNRIRHGTHMGHRLYLPQHILYKEPPGRSATRRILTASQQRIASQSARVDSSNHPSLRCTNTNRPIESQDQRPPPPYAAAQAHRRFCSRSRIRFVMVHIIECLSGLEHDWNVKKRTRNMLPLSLYLLPCNHIPRERRSYLRAPRMERLLVCANAVNARATGQWNMCLCSERATRTRPLTGRVALETSTRVYIVHTASTWLLLPLRRAWSFGVFDGYGFSFGHH